MIKPRRTFIFLLAGIFAMSGAGFLVAVLALGLAVVSLMAGNHSPSAAQPPVLAAVAPLRWSGLEASTPDGYAANLHAIGCPEPTIAAIIQERFVAAAAPIEPPAGLAIQPQIPMNQGAAGASYSVAAPPVTLLTALPAPEASVIAPAAASSPRVFNSAMAASFSNRVPASGSVVAASRGRPAAGASGVASSPGAPADAKNSASEQVVTAPEGGDVAIPAAFQELASDSKLTTVQKQNVDDLQRQFVDEIGGPEQDPASDDYRNRWQTAQIKSDQRFRLIFGQQALLQRQLQENLHQDE